MNHRCHLHDESKQGLDNVICILRHADVDICNLFVSVFLDGRDLGAASGRRLEGARQPKRRRVVM